MKELYVWKLSEAIGRGAVDFHPDLPKIDKAELVGADFVILQAKIIEEWESEYGTSSFCLLRVRLENAEEKTTLMGGKAIVRQVSKLLRDRKLPVRVCLNKREGSYGDYYVLEDPVSQEPAPVSGESQLEEPIFPESEG